MQLLYILKELLIGFQQGLNTDVWVEVTTSDPHCIYYFGPFQNRREAQIACPGYIEDLKSEGNQGIEVIIKHCQPEVLTVFDE